MSGRAPDVIPGSAPEWRAVLEPVVDAYRSQGIPVYFRADATFAMPEVYEYLEDDGVLFALACYLANFLRRLALPLRMKHWSLTNYG